MKKLSIFVFCIILMTSLACGLPAQAGEGEPASNEQMNQVETMVAQTLTAQVAIEAESAPQETPEPPAQSLTPENTATITPTATPGVPMASVSVSTNCRTGPSTEFDLLGSLAVGQSAEVVGKYQNGAYWIIETPGSSGNCWLWGNYATVSGNTSSLPEYPAPPTPTPAIPLAPGNFNANISCTLQLNPVMVNIVSANLSWTDNANNETGYRVYRNGELIKTLDANATMTGDETSMAAVWVVDTPKPSITYGVEAFNNAGASVRVEQTVSCH
jgi:uncharacterized protein YgiM (DUF1202 family)